MSNIARELLKKQFLGEPSLSFLFTREHCSVTSLQLVVHHWFLSTDSGVPLLKIRLLDEGFRKFDNNAYERVDSFRTHGVCTCLLRKLRFIVCRRHEYPLQ